MKIVFLGYGNLANEKYLMISLTGSRTSDIEIEGVISYKKNPALQLYQ